jgi:catechol 2,3-dioxygenase-like lactoylglutathione lyase family enzyme
MNLNHLDLQVSDVAAARDFFIRHFDLQLAFEREGEIALMRDEVGFSLAVSNLFGSPPPTYPPDFHIGFVLAEEAQLRAHYDRIRDAGVALKAELSRGGPNLYFVCLGPDSIPIEVSAPRDAG